MFRYAIFLASLLVPAIVIANPASDREKFTAIGADVGGALGAGEYCGLDAKPMLATFSQGLEAFGLRPMDIQAVLASTEQHRQQGRAQASGTLKGQPCPPDARENIRQTLQNLESSWVQVVQSSTGVDLQKSAASANTAQRAQTKPAPKPAQQTAQPAGLCVRGNSVSVSQAGQWYPAKVLDGPDNMGTCKVSYDGYGSNWDEWVSAQRMRPATGGAGASKSPTGQNQSQPASKQSTAVPPGKYSCYTFDAGQLNYTYTDVVIRDASQYSVGNKSGTYQLSADGALRFTGTLSNATGKFSVKSSGKPQIDLIFNGDPRSSMACARS